MKKATLDPPKIPLQTGQLLSQALFLLKTFVQKDFFHKNIFATKQNKFVTGRAFGNLPSNKGPYYLASGTMQAAHSISTSSCAFNKLDSSVLNFNTVGVGDDYLTAHQYPSVCYTSSSHPSDFVFGSMVDDGAPC